VNIYDKQIHRDEFRLRLLVTDGCNTNCFSCLNDFQEKPSGSPQFMDSLTAHMAASTYVEFCSNMGINKRLITLSGGEPGLHPNLRDIVLTCHGAPSRVTLNTNGLAYKSFRQTYHSMVDNWHVGTNRIDLDLIEDLRRTNATVQIVVTKHNQNIIDHVIGYYADYNLLIKLFMDFNEDESFRDQFKNIVENAELDYPTQISTRFTGVQENRGKLCDDCTKKCITLKALWVMPTGEVKACPQAEGTFPETKVEWEQAVKDAYENHLVKEDSK